MAFQFVPAEQITTSPPLIVALSGMSGSGKTYSALLLAKAIAEARGGPVCGVCTESGRMARYKDRKLYPELYPYLIGEIAPPFHSERFSEALDMMRSQEAGCGIIDSFSDEWEGPGGVLKRQEETLERMAGGDIEKRKKLNPKAWAEVKEPHTDLHGQLLRMRIPIILCHRAREKTGFRGGRFIDLGVQPIYDSRLEYEFTFHLMMDREKQDGSYSFLKQGYRHERGVFPPGGKVDAAAIARLVTTYYGSSAEPESESEPEPVTWKLVDRKYVCSGDASSKASRKALYGMMLKQFAIRPRSKKDCVTDQEIFTLNLDLIATFPEKAQQQIHNLGEVLINEGAS